MQNRSWKEKSLPTHTHTHTPHTPTLPNTHRFMASIGDTTILHMFTHHANGDIRFTSNDRSWPVNYHRVQTFYSATGDITPIAKGGALTHHIASCIQPLLEMKDIPVWRWVPNWLGKYRNIYPIEAKNQRTPTHPTHLLVRRVEQGHYVCPRFPKYEFTVCK